MKKHNYLEFSDQKCIDCGTFLTKNLVENNPGAIRCYKCYQAKKGKKIGVKPEKTGEPITKEAPKVKEHKSKYPLKRERQATGDYTGSPLKPINT